MGRAVSILLLVAGAVVRYGLTRSTYGDWNLDALGAIAMIVGAVGLLAGIVVRIPRRRQREPEVVESRGSHVHAAH